MKIIDKKPSECTFENLEQGDVFKDKYGNYCMKIEPCNDCDDSINFISLSDGCAGGWLENFAVVTKVNCELVIKD